MKVAALYDIHGNLPALEAVLREVEREAPDAIVVGGDISSLGPMPAEVLAQLRDLGDHVRFICGNVDRMLVDDFDARAASALTRDDEPNLWVRRSRWASARIGKEHRNFLASLPQTAILEVDGLGPTLFCHASPRSDEEVVTRLTPPDALDEIFGGVAESTVVCGHTHMQFERLHCGRRIVNAGSVGLHREGQPGAYWALLGPGVGLRRTLYDLDDAARRIRATDFPEPEQLIARLCAKDNIVMPEEEIRMLERSAGRVLPSL